MVLIPRVVIAAPGSGHGKTSVATGLLAAFRARGLTVSPHKVGPDYIDPGYHGVAAGRPGRNLDPWLVGEDLIAPLFVHGATTPTVADLAIIEGVMGLFDGATGLGDFASTAHVASLLSAPVVLVVDASGVGRSIAALVHGFATYEPGIRIGGVILNRVGTDRHRQILVNALEGTGIPVLGSVPRLATLTVPSRHLGLVPAAERSAEAGQAVAELGAAIAAGVDLEAISRLAASSPPLNAISPIDTAQVREPRVTVAIAAGAAFTFGYAEQGELLAASGAEIVTFDPLRDEELPAETAGIVIGGGFPEMHAVALSANTAMRRAVAAAARAGLPIAAECAGLLYLGNAVDGQPMCGVLDTEATMTTRLTLGYREAIAPGDSVLAAAGTRVRGHEFHRTTCSPPSGSQPAWQWRNNTVVSDGFVQANVHASYLHLHWAGFPAAAERFVVAARDAHDGRPVTP